MYAVFEEVSGPDMFDLISLGAYGFSYLHANGFVHRDLKAENVSLDDKFEVKISGMAWA